MARVTVEDCVDKVPNRFELVLLAAQRARNLSRGEELTLDRDNDKNPVVALREIAGETIELRDDERTLRALGEGYGLLKDRTIRLPAGFHFDELADHRRAGAGTECLHVRALRLDPETGLVLSFGAAAKVSDDFLIHDHMLHP